MSDNLEIGLARRIEARAIAGLSCEIVEHGFRWSWTPGRVRQAMADRATNVVVARDGQEVLGFALLRYRTDDAYLMLLGVQATRRRRGVGKALLAWLMETLKVAGVFKLGAHVRENNVVARAFYAAAGFREVELVRGYYFSVENAVRVELLLA